MSLFRSILADTKLWCDSKSKFIVCVWLGTASWTKKKKGKRKSRIKCARAFTWRQTWRDFRLIDRSAQTRMGFPLSSDFCWPVHRTWPALAIDIVSFKNQFEFWRFIFFFKKKTIKNQVLWMRQRDLHILTSGLHTYTNDWRISAVHVTVRQPPHGGPVVPANGEDVSSSPSFAPVANGNAAMASSASRNASGPADSSSSVWDDEDGVWSEWTLVTFKWFFCFVLIWFSFLKKMFSFDMGRGSVRQRPKTPAFTNVKWALSPKSPRSTDFTLSVSRPLNSLTSSTSASSSEFVFKPSLQYDVCVILKNKTKIISKTTKVRALLGSLEHALSYHTNNNNKI